MSLQGMAHLPQGESDNDPDALDEKYESIDELGFMLGIPKVDGLGQSIARTTKKHDTIRNMADAAMFGV